LEVAEFFWPYGEEKITMLEEEVIPAIQQCLARIDEGTTKLAGFRCRPEEQPHCV
jgi:hypothetical protein